MSRKRRVLAGLAIAALVGVGALWQAVFSPETYRGFERPDGAYRVIVLRQPMIASMPGQAGDAPGIVRLVDRDGRRLGQADVGMVQMVQEVDWRGSRAFIRFVADWPLP